MLRLNRLPVLVLGGALLVLTGCETLDSIFGASEEAKVPGKRVSVLVVEQKLKVDPTLAKTPVNLPAAITNSDWSQIGGAPTHVMGNLTLGSDLKQAWAANAGDGPQDNLRYIGTPIIGDGKVFVLDTQAEVTALDANSGSVLWRVRVSPTDVRTDTLGGGLAYGGGRLYVTAGYPEILAVDPANGGMIWRKQLAAPARAAATYSDGKLFLATLDNQSQMLNAADGTQAWSHAGLPESEAVLGEASIAVDPTIAIVPYSSGEIFALRVESGRVAWQDNLISIRHTNALWSLTDISVPPVLDHGRVFAVSVGGRFVAIDLRTGTRAWQKEIGSTNMPWVTGDYVFLLDNDDELVCMSRDTGGVYWIAQLQQFENIEKRKDAITWQGPVAAGGRLVLTNSLGQIQEVSVADGRVLSTTELDSPITVAPIIADGMLFILNDDGTLIAYR